jgi:putative polyhydroxyalkanoate system protein
MSLIHVDYKHSLSQEEAIRRANQLVGEMGHRVKADIHWNGPIATFKGTGFSGRAKLTDHLIALDLELGFLLRPLRGKIEERIERHLQTRFS